MRHCSELGGYLGLPTNGIPSAEPHNPSCLGYGVLCGSELVATPTATSGIYLRLALVRLHERNRLRAGIASQH